MPPKSPKEMPEHDRPRETLIKKGATALKDKELLAILLRTGTKGNNVFQVASTILNHDTNVEDMSIAELSSIKGVGTAKACIIAAAFELARRRLDMEDKEVYTIRKPEDLLPHINHIADKKQEYFLCTSLNGANEIIDSRTITVGLLNSSQVHPREVFADAITDRAASIILAHNHPSGTLEPSKADTMITRQLCESGKLLGIEVLDHIIITRKGFVSLKDKGYM